MHRLCSRSVRFVYTRGAFTDRLRVTVEGGSGGSGLLAFDSLDNVRRRPVGGHGGAGGAVSREARTGISDLRLAAVVRGRDGGAARGSGNNGRAGAPTVRAAMWRLVSEPTGPRGQVTTLTLTLRGGKRETVYLRGRCPEAPPGQQRPRRRAVGARRPARHARHRGAPLAASGR